MKLTKFKETRASIEKLLMKQVMKESLEQAKGSIVGMNTKHDKLQDVYTWWFDKTNRIIEECKEQRKHIATSGSGMSHKWVLGACWSRKAPSQKLHSFEDVSQDLLRGCGTDKVQRGYHNTKTKD